MRTIRIEVPGIPVGKGRPRFTRAGRTYTPERTREFENRIAGAFLATDEYAFKAGTELTLDVIAEMPIPKSLPKKTQAFLEGRMHTKRPDLDNIVKAVLDGLNGLAFADDSQVGRMYAFKQYSREPKTVIVLSGEEDER